MMYCQHYTVLMIASNIKIIIISESTPVCCTSIPSITACMINSAGNLASTGYFQKKTPYNYRYQRVSPTSESSQTR